MNIIDKTNEAFEHYLKFKSFELFLPLKDELYQLWQQHAENESDWRNGDETYGYESPNTIESTMNYIADRWRCAFRIKWIIDGIESGKFVS